MYLEPLNGRDSSFLPSEEAFLIWQTDVQNTQSWASKPEFALTSIAFFHSSAVHTSIHYILLHFQLRFILEIYGIYQKSLFFNALCYFSLLFVISVIFFFFSTLGKAVQCRTIHIPDDVGLGVKMNISFLP